MENVMTDDAIHFGNPYKPLPQNNYLAEVLRLETGRQTQWPAFVFRFKVLGPTAFAGYETEQFVPRYKNIGGNQAFSRWCRILLAREIIPGDAIYPEEFKGKQCVISVVETWTEARKRGNKVTDIRPAAEWKR